jgi:hypothetical protein
MSKHRKRGGGRFGGEMWQDKALPSGWVQHLVLLELPNSFISKRENRAPKHVTTTEKSGGRHEAQVSTLL